MWQDVFTIFSSLYWCNACMISKMLITQNHKWLQRIPLDLFTHAGMFFRFGFIFKESLVESKHQVQFFFFFENSLLQNLIWASVNLILYWLYFFTQMHFLFYGLKHVQFIQFESLQDLELIGIHLKYYHKYC